MITDIGPLLGKISAALLLAACRSGGNETRLEAQYQWGPDCPGDLSIGLAVSATQLSRQAPLEWRMAIKNLTPEPRQLVIGNDLDRFARYRLEVDPIDGGGPVTEFAPEPKGAPSTGNIRRTVESPAAGIAELETEIASIGERLGPGNYRIKVVFGGKDFDFRCESGTITVVVE